MKLQCDTRRHQRYHFKSASSTIILRRQSRWSGHLRLIQSLIAIYAPLWLLVDIKVILFFFFFLPPPPLCETDGPG